MKTCAICNTPKPHTAFAKKESRCKDCNYERHQEWYKLNEEREKEKRKVYIERRKQEPGWMETQRTNRKRKERAAREHVIQHYGGKCDCCGESKYEFLSIDHLNGSGSEHRKKEKGTIKIARWLINNGMPEGFRVLCHNCNLSFGFYGFCPHNPEGK